MSRAHLISDLPQPRERRWQRSWPMPCDPSTVPAWADNTPAVGEPVPSLDVPLVSGGRHVLGADPGEHFDLIVFYRGLHCPICAKYLLELERLSPEFLARGVKLLALSSDDETRGRAMAEKVKATGLRPRSACRAAMGPVHHCVPRQGIQWHP